MPKKENPPVVTDEPSVEPAFEEFDYSAFLLWDDYSEMIASSGTMLPPWFRQVGLDDGEVLLFSPLPEMCPDGEDKAEYLKRRWAVEGAEIATVCCPTKKAMGALMTAKEPEEKAKANVTIVAECLVSLPVSAVAKRAFKIGGVTVIAKGEHMFAPMDFIDGELPEKMNAKDVIPIYILNFLPDRVRKVVHTAALCMAVPEVEFVVAKGKEKDEEKPARMRPHVPRGAGEDDNFIEGSSGSSGPK